MKIELFFKSASQLSAVLQSYAQRVNPSITTIPSPTIQSQSIYHYYNIPNKVKHENILPFTSTILSHFPQADVCLHYSLKNHPCKRMDDASQEFIKFVNDAKEVGAKEVLLISGSGAKRAINAVTLLQYLDKYALSLPEGMKIGVAFNPYYTSEEEKQAEYQRLVDKLNTNLVNIVYLQFGTNVEMLKEALEFLQQNVNREKHIIYGSTFLPSKQLIARMKFRPWAGLMLSDEFLTSVEEAEKIVNEMLEIYDKFQVIPIIETAFKTEKEIDYMENLLKLRK